MLVHEFDHSGETEAPLAALGSMMSEPAAIRVSANGRRAHAKQATYFLQRKLRIEEASNKLFSGFLEFATIVVGGDGVIKETAQEGDILGEGSPNFPKLRVDRAHSLSIFRTTGPGRA